MVKAWVDLALKADDFGSRSSFLAWLGVAPLRVQFFLWCLLERKILTRAILSYRRLLNSNEDLSCVP